MTKTSYGIGVLQMLTSLVSGFIGAFFTQVFISVREAKSNRKAFHALLISMLAECDYNLSILDEIANGSTDGHASFKRLSVEYFSAAHEKVIKYNHDYVLLKLLSTVTIDMELFNREVDFVFNDKASRKCKGFRDESAVEIEKQVDMEPIDDTIKRANIGVRGSLKALKAHIEEQYGVEVDDGK